MDELLVYINGILLAAGLSAELLGRGMVILAGSYAIAGRDAHSDVDLFLLWDSSEIQRVREQLGVNYVLDDKTHQPNVFGLIKERDWLRERLENKIETYLWICRHAIILRDPGDVCRYLISQAESRFLARLDDIIMDHYVRYRANRNSLKNTIARASIASQLLIKADIASTSLQLTLLLSESPYPYLKWLPWYVEHYAVHGKELTVLAQNLLCAEPGELTALADHQLRNKVVSIMEDRTCSIGWGGCVRTAGAEQAATVRSILPDRTCGNRGWSGVCWTTST